MPSTRRVVSQGKRRPGLPQRKDQGRYTVAERSRDHGEGGRFAKGNGAAAKRAIKQIIRKHLGPQAGGAEVEAVYKDARKLYDALLQGLPANQAAEVQDLVARRARWSVLSARFAAKAAEVGLFGDHAQKLLEMALRLDARAERLAVTARDEAERLAAVPTDPMADHQQAAQLLAAWRQEEGK